MHNFSSKELAAQGWTHMSLLDNCQRYENAILRSDDQSATALINFHCPSPDIVEVLFLATSPFFQGQGLMSLLLEEFIAYQKGKTIWLECREDNVKARHLYEKKGFKEVGRRPHYYKDGSAAILFNY